MLLRLRIENLVLIREAELEFGAGLNAVTGETGAGKTIFAQAIGLLLGQKGDSSFVGPAGSEAYVEAELSVPDGFFEDDELSALGELRPEGEQELVIARRVFADGRTRAYAWGRSIAREDVAAAAERLIAMSGQFEQRRLARSSFQLDLLDAFVGDEQLARRRAARTAWRELSAARRKVDELSRNASALEQRVEELRALVEATEGLESGSEEQLKLERDRIRNVAELGRATSEAIAALTGEDGAGAAELVAQAERSVAQVERLSPDLGAAGDELRAAELRLREVSSSLSGFLAGLEADPLRLEQLEAELDRIAQARRRFRCTSTDELLERATEAQAELEALDEGFDPLEAAERELELADQVMSGIAGDLRGAREAATDRFTVAVSEELRGVGMGDGEFRAQLREREVGPSGGDEVVFLIRPNRGLPFAPVADTASGGELSRVALALAAVAGGETLVFDEIDAGIGGRTANAVGETLERLAGRAQLITITHLPQIASRADRHFQVEKVAGDPTHTEIELLDEGRRRAEIERMLGGEEFLASVGAVGQQD